MYEIQLDGYVLALHIVLMGLAFGIITPISVMIARNWRYWYKITNTLQLYK